MPSYLGNKELEAFVGNIRIREMYIGNLPVYQYDSIAPVLTVAAPTGTSSGSPTYVQSDSAYNYTVSGTISDADSGVKAISVNGQTATVNNGNWSIALQNLPTNKVHEITITAEDNAGNINTMKRYLRIEAYYNYAARSVGYSNLYGDISALFADTNAIRAVMANNAAYNIMKNTYMSNVVASAAAINAVLYSSYITDFCNNIYSNSSYLSSVSSKLTDTTYFTATESWQEVGGGSEGRGVGGGTLNLAAANKTVYSLVGISINYGYGTAIIQSGTVNGNKALATNVRGSYINSYYGWAYSYQYGTNVVSQASISWTSEYDSYYTWPSKRHVYKKYVAK